MSPAPGDADPGPRPGHFDPRRPVDAELELTVGDGFTLTAVGDCILSRPISQHRHSQPAFAALLDVLRGDGVTYGNLETVLVDHDRAAASPYPWLGDWPLSCDPGVAADLRAMGFDLLSRANNHTLDWGLEGMRETSRLLDEHGLTHAGSGENLSLARRAKFLETRYGRVAHVSCVTTFRETTDALDPCGAAAGRPGVSGLAVKRVLTAPDDVFDQLGALRDRLAAAGIDDLLGEFERGGDRPQLRYEMDGDQLAAVLREIRQGKQFADFMLVALHAHEGLTSPDPGTDRWTPPLPPAFVTEFGRHAIEAGADAVVVTGMHHLGPIEIHRRRPILTGLGNFVWSDIQTPLSADIHRRAATAQRDAFDHPGRATEADLTLMMNMPTFAREECFLSVAAEMRFDRSGLTRLTLHPVDLGYGDRLTLSGLPRLAGPSQATIIFERLRDLCAPRGTDLVTRLDAGRSTILAEVAL